MNMYFSREKSILNSYWISSSNRLVQSYVSFLFHTCLSVMLKNLGSKNIPTVTRFYVFYSWGFPGGSVGKESTCNAGDLGLISGSERYLEEWNGNSLQYSCLKNPMNREAWQATVRGVTKSWTRLSRWVCMNPEMRIINTTECDSNEEEDKLANTFPLFPPRGKK